MTCLYLDGRKPAEEPTTEKEASPWRALAKVDEAALAGVGKSRAEKEPITAETWQTSIIRSFQKLLRDKRIIVQGSGKVGGSFIEEMAKYPVIFAAVADRDGALIGRLDPAEMLQSARTTGSVFGCKKGVEERIAGAEEGKAVLELECDILVPAALENAISAANAEKVRARLVVCGANGPHTTKAEKTFSAG